jgi:hypothetical protein
MDKSFRLIPEYIKKMRPLLWLPRRQQAEPKPEMGGECQTLVFVNAANSLLKKIVTY